MREVAKGERVGKSDGFNDYDWMIDNIIARDTAHSEITS